MSERSSSVSVCCRFGASSAASHGCLCVPDQERLPCRCDDADLPPGQSSTLGGLSLKPLIYGYLRRLPEMDDAVEARLIAELVAFTRAEGFTLGELFIEADWGGTASLHALTDHCRLDEVRHVVVPSLDHLNTIPVLADVSKDELSKAINGQVWIVRPEIEESSCSPATSRGEP